MVSSVLLMFMVDGGYVIEAMWKMKNGGVRWYQLDMMLVCLKLLNGSPENCHVCWDKKGCTARSHRV